MASTAASSSSPGPAVHHPPGHQPDDGVPTPPLSEVPEEAQELRREVDYIMGRRGESFKTILNLGHNFTKMEAKRCQRELFSFGRRLLN